MKFVCEHCGAKYQIADEKIAGRNLRMVCKNKDCRQTIIIRGPRSTEAAPKARPKRQLSQDFQSKSLAPEQPSPARTWYVAIEDVPVGPIKMEELRQKMRAGAVAPESLCWSEGMSDWRPVRAVPEVFAAFQQETRSAAPPGPKSRPLPPPPPARRKNPPAPAPVARKSIAPKPAAKPPESELPLENEFNEEPTALGQSFSDELAFGDPLELPAVAPAESPEADASALASREADALPSEKDEEGEVAAAFAPPEAAAAPLGDLLVDGGGAGGSAFPSQVPPKEQRMSIGGLALLLGAIAFGTVLALVTAQRLLFAGDDGPAVAQSGTDAIVPETSAQANIAIPEDLPEDLETDTPPSEEGETSDNAGGDRTTNRNSGSGNSMRVARPAGTTSGSTSSNMGTTAAGMQELTDAQRRMIERMGAGSNDPDLGGIRRPTMTSMSGASPSQIDADMLRRVVNNNMSSIQRCYNTAIRGNPSPPDVRLSVTINIRASGSVSNVTTSNSPLGMTLSECVKGNIRRWRFPATQSGGRSEFPLVFRAPS